jgi:hypothetical protein
MATATLETTTLDQQSIRERNRAWQDMFDYDHPGAAYGSMQLTWRFEPAFSLAEIHPDRVDVDYESPEEWSEWYAGERAGSVRYYWELEAKWLFRPEELPLVVARGSDGRLYLWDGRHRIGISHMKGWTHAPAWVGEFE